jgi:integrase
LPRGVSYQFLKGNPLPHRFVVRDPKTGKRSTQCFDNSKEGESWSDGTLAEFKAGTRTPGRVAWTKASADYISELKGTNRRTHYIEAVQRVADHITNKGAGDITNERFPGIVREYLANVKADEGARQPGADLSPSTLVKRLAIIRAICHSAQKRHRIFFDPVSSVKAPKIRKRRVETLTLDELRECLAPDRESHPYFLRFALLAYLGLRDREGLHLRWQDYDTARRMITVKEQPKLYDLKNGEREIPVPTELAAILLRHPRKKNVFILPDSIRLEKPKKSLEGKTEKKSQDDQPEKKPVEDRTDYARFKAFLHDAIGEERAALICRHAMRHLYARLMAATGVSLSTLFSYLGHASISTTMIYAQGSQSYEPLVVGWERGELRLRKRSKRSAAAG